MTTVTNQVMTTDEYDKFKVLIGNRDLNRLHLQRLEKSILKNPLFTTIMVNEKFEIIDGQHRFNIIKKHKLPLNYIICQGYGLDEVHVLNANQKKFDAIDYLDGYVKQGLPEYIKFKNFMDKFDFKIMVCLSLLRNTAQNGTNTRDFYEGTFVCQNIAKAEKLAKDLIKIRSLFEDADKTLFVTAYLTVTKSPNWNADEFIEKLKIQKGKLEIQGKASQYVTLIEDIFNYKRREKVSLRYSK